MTVVLLSMHPAVTFDGRVQLVQDGPLQGLLFSCKEKKVKRLCPEAVSLVERLNDVHMNMLPWHELQAWRSDGGMLSRRLQPLQRDAALPHPPPSSLLQLQPSVFPPLPSSLPLLLAAAPSPLHS